MWVALVSYCFGFALFGCEVTVLGPTLTALARQVHVAEVDLSPLFTTLGLTTIIGGLPSGWLVDRVPGHVIIVVSLILQVWCHHTHGQIWQPLTLRDCQLVTPYPNTDSSCQTGS